jgi:beta-lactam-binding protein with PASTA domain
MKDEAIRILSEANFTAFVSVVDAVEPKDTVVSQSPGGGAFAPLGSAITINVSSGKAPKSTVPNVVGKSQSSATSALQGAGFAVKVTFQDVDKKSDDGKVIDQSPNANTSQPEGTTVTIVVGRFKGEPSPSPSPGG